MRPQQIKKSNFPSDNKISIGRVVEYLQHGKSVIGVTSAQKRDRWSVVNPEGAELDLGVERMELLPGAAPDSATTNALRAKFLQGLIQSADQLANAANLEEVWSVLAGETEEISLTELVELVFGEHSLTTAVAMRRLMHKDQVFFKKRKADYYEPRSAAVVEELKYQVSLEAERREKKARFIEQILKRLKDPLTSLPPEIADFESLAALGKGAPTIKESQALLEEVLQKTGLSLTGTPADKAFELLCRLRHFTVHENLIPLRLGRPTFFSSEELDAAQTIATFDLAQEHFRRQDFTALLTLTIDGADTKDFDDALSLERLDNGYRVGIHICDVSAIIQADSLIELAALRRASSIYCPDQHFPMLPEILSQDALSLREGTVRPAVTFWIEFDRDYQKQQHSVERTLIKVGQRLTYEQADIMLCDEHAQASDIHGVLHGLWSIAQASENRRAESGAIQFARRELTPVIDDQGIVRLDVYDEDTPARKLVSELMVLANSTGAALARHNNFPLIFRSQETPDVDLSNQGLEIPEGSARDFFRRSMFKRSIVGVTPLAHFGLGLQEYAQLTSPLRRAVDLLNQRQLCTFIETGQPAYNAEALQLKLSEVSLGLDETNQISRERQRYWLLQYLVQENVKSVTATVMKLDGAKPLCEVEMLTALFLFTTREAQARSRLKLGDKIELKIDNINPRKDLISLVW